MSLFYLSDLHRRGFLKLNYFLCYTYFSKKDDQSIIYNLISKKIMDRNNSKHQKVIN